MTMAPRTGDGSAMSASRTTAWYHWANVDRLPVILDTLRARCDIEFLRIALIARVSYEGMSRFATETQAHSRYGES
jgi:hypothetical protein